MVTDSGAGALLGLSNDLANAVETAGVSIVTVHARNRVPSSGVHWTSGVVVTADHTVERDDGITVGLPDGRTLQATVAGRIPAPTSQSSRSTPATCRQRRSETPRI